MHAYIVPYFVPRIYTRIDFLNGEGEGEQIRIVPGENLEANIEVDFGNSTRIKRKYSLGLVFYNGSYIVYV